MESDSEADFEGREDSASKREYDKMQRNLITVRVELLARRLVVEANLQNSYEFEEK